MVTHLLARSIAFYQGPPFHSNQVSMNEQIQAIDVAIKGSKILSQTMPRAQI